MASLEPCRYCNSEGWITPQITEDNKKQLDDIDKMLLRMFGQQRIKKLCPVCHGNGKDDITRWAIITVKACKCNVCGHVWLTNLPCGTLPAHCSKCKSIL